MAVRADLGLDGGRVLLGTGHCAGAGHERERLRVRVGQDDEPPELASLGRRLGRFYREGPWQGLRSAHADGRSARTTRDRVRPDSR